MDVSIIIVNFNTKDLTIDCIKSIFEYTNGINYELIIVDNASSDGSVYAIKESFPSVIVIESDVNLGFGKANNLGVKSANGKYLFFLNPDCILIENATKKMFDYYELNNNDENRIGTIGCMLLDKNLKFNISYQRFPTPGSQIKKMLISLINRMLKTKIATKPYRNYKLHSNNEVDFITGADLFIKKEIFISLGGFDPRFFMYYEETDLQKRMTNDSLKRIILNDVNIIHLEGGSTTKKLKTTTIFIDSEFKYMRKHFSLIVFILYYFTRSISLIPYFLNRSIRKEEKKIFFNMLLRRWDPHT